MSNHKAIVKVKICGITRPEDARLAEQAGADAIGMIFAEISKRRVDVNRAKEISKAVGIFTKRVGVFLNSPLDEVLQIANELRLDAVQLHGDEPDLYVAQVAEHFHVIKTVAIVNDVDRTSLEQIPAHALLIEGATPGSGDVFDWSKAEALRGMPHLILAGGLTPENVVAGIEALQPYAVDVASGVEKPLTDATQNTPSTSYTTSYPTKDARKVLDFVRAAKGQ